jgi:protein phosphatase 1 regulatory subunit 7
MPGSLDKENDGHAHVDIQNDLPSPRAEGDTSPVLRNSKGWDGKLRVPKTALVANPEALSDPEYSDDENVLDGGEIAADEGTVTWLHAMNKTDLCRHRPA